MYEYIYYMCIFAHTHKYSEQISPAGLSFPLKIIKFSIIIRSKCGSFFIFVAFFWLCVLQRFSSWDWNDWCYIYIHMYFVHMAY